MTKMIPIEEIFPDVLTFVSACPEPVLQRHVIEVAQEFCRETKIWRDTDRMKITGAHCEGVCSYANTHILGILDARLNGRLLTAQTTHWLDTNIPRWDDEDYTGQAEYVTQINPMTLRVVPGEQGMLKVRLTLSPSRDADELPEFLMDEYRLMIASAVAGRIMILPALDISDPQRGQALIQEFNSRLPQIKTKVTKTQLGARLRTRPHYF